MGNLSVRRIDDATLERLRLRAQHHGVSMEEEARRILQQAVAAPERLGDLAVRLFSPGYGEPALDLPERDVPEPLVFPLDDRINGSAARQSPTAYDLDDDDAIDKNDTP